MILYNFDGVERNLIMTSGRHVIREEKITGQPTFMLIYASSFQTTTRKQAYNIRRYVSTL